MPAEFENTAELRGARFTRVDLSGSRFRDVDFRGVKIADSFLSGAHLSGVIEGLRINDVEVAPLIEAELDRRDPDRLLIRSATTAEGMRRAWALVEERWDATLDRARCLPEPVLHERVDEEWSFIETLRHLIFATDAWVLRTILGETRPYCPFGLVHDGFGDPTWLGIDPDATPLLDDVVAARLERMTLVRGVVENLEDDDLLRTCGANPARGYPTQTEVTVGRCLGITLNEEWSHHDYALRDLAELELRI